MSEITKEQFEKTLKIMKKAEDLAFEIGKVKNYQDFSFFIDFNENLISFEVLDFEDHYLDTIDIRYEDLIDPSFFIEKTKNEIKMEKEAEEKRKEAIKEKMAFDEEKLAHQKYEELKDRFG